MNYYEWFTKAKKSIDSLNCGGTFTLSKLLCSSGWETLEAGDKIKFGKRFKEDVLNNVSSMKK